MITVFDTEDIITTSGGGDQNDPLELDPQPFPFGG